MLIVYDGACPICSRYAALVRLNSICNVELLNARSAVAKQRLSPAEIKRIIRELLVRTPHRDFWGGEAVWLLGLRDQSSLESALKGTRNPPFAWQGIYYILSCGRRLILALTGRSPDIST